MTKYDAHDHIAVLTELNVLYKVANETQTKISISQLNTMLKNTIRQSQDEQNGTANVRLGIQKREFLV